MIHIVFYFNLSIHLDGPTHSDVDAYVNMWPVFQDEFLFTSLYP